MGFSTTCLLRASPLYLTLATQDYWLLSTGSFLLAYMFFYVYRPGFGACCTNVLGIWRREAREQISDVLVEDVCG